MSGTRTGTDAHGWVAPAQVRAMMQLAVLAMINIFPLETWRDEHRVNESLGPLRNVHGSDRLPSATDLRLFEPKESKDDGEGNGAKWDVHI
jgi:hypothetical protein